MRLRPQIGRPQRSDRFREVEAFTKEAATDTWLTYRSRTAGSDPVWRSILLWINGSSSP